MLKAQFDPQAGKMMLAREAAGLSDDIWLYVIDTLSDDAWVLVDRKSIALKALSSANRRMRRLGFPSIFRSVVIERGPALERFSEISTTNPQCIHCIRTLEIGTTHLVEWKESIKKKREWVDALSTLGKRIGPSLQKLVVVASEFELVYELPPELAMKLKSGLAVFASYATEIMVRFVNGFVFVDIERYLANAVRVEHLSVDTNSGTILSWSPPSTPKPLTLPRSLRSLSLYGYNCLPDGSFAGTLPQLTSLTYLRIRGASFSSIDVLSFHKALLSISHQLTMLEIQAFNPVTRVYEAKGNTWESGLPAILRECDALISLGLYGAVCTAEIVRSICGKSLRDLHLVCDLEDEDAISNSEKAMRYSDFCEAVLQLKRVPLKELYVSHAYAFRAMRDRDDEVNDQLRAEITSARLITFTCTIASEGSVGANDSDSDYSTWSET